MDDSRMVEYLATCIAGALYKVGWNSGEKREEGFDVGADIHRLVKDEARLMSAGNRD
jgi:hypothetical protein